LIDFVLIVHYYYVLFLSILLSVVVKRSLYMYIISKKLNLLQKTHCWIFVLLLKNHQVC